jgi:hypothetical protein
MRAELSLFIVDHVSLALGLASSQEYDELQPGDVVWLDGDQVEDLYGRAEAALDGDRGEDPRPWPVAGLRAECPSCRAYRGGSYWLVSHHDADVLYEYLNAACTKCGTTFLRITPEPFLWDDDEVSAVLDPESRR